MLNLKKFLPLLILLVVLSSFASAALSDSEAYYKFDDNNVSQFDSTGNGNDGTVTGASFNTSGFINGNYDYDGSGDFITLDSNTDLDITTGNFTINVWVNIPSISAGNHQSI